MYSLWKDCNEKRELKGGAQMSSVGYTVLFSPGFVLDPKLLRTDYWAEIKKIEC